MEEIRLQKYMADMGIASRRKCEQHIIDRKVKVNNKLVTELGTKINPNTDVVSFEGKIIKNVKKDNIYILLNKPTGYVTTVEDEFSRDTVLELVEQVQARIVPVGRLDMYTSGALILTNDGDFIYKVTHPKYEINKTYVATVRGLVDNKDIEKLEKGVQIEDYTTKPAKVKIIKNEKQKNISEMEITIHEGKNREVRKMCESIDKEVIALHRSKIGNIDVKDLKIGTWRYLTKNEVKTLLK